MITEDELKNEVLKIESFAEGIKQGAILLAKNILNEQEKQKKSKKNEV